MANPIYSTYYDTRKNLHRYFGPHSRGLGLRTSKPAAVKAWQAKARRRLVELLALAKLKPAPAKARRDESVDCGDHVREHWLMRSQPDVTVPFYLLRPKGAEGRLPAVICPHGHGGGGKVAPAGVRIAPEVAQSIEQHNYDYGVQFARAGLLAFCPDARGFGQRQEKEVRANVLASSCHHIHLMSEPLGIPLAGLWVFDLMRLMDHVQSRRDVSKGRVGCAGLSGGGLQTLYFSAVDERVACAVVSGYFYGVLESLLEMPNNCPCNIVPHLWEDFDMGDLGALIAPRPLVIETGDADPLNGASGLKNVLPQVAIARRAYRGRHAADRLRHDIFPGPHKWHGAVAVPWMKKWLA
jgi:dienelactone hydrolase